ncbi:MAG: SDR family oxidoreductase [Caldilineales bacterium]|nr:SDR family oxidoreductase [Caldilineales bacterium]
MDLTLAGRVAAVAAASKGLGKAVAQELAAEGAQVAICSRSLERAAVAAHEIQAATGAKVLPVACDVSTKAGCEFFIDRTAQHFGQLDILVTNAGGPPSGPADSFSDEQWQQAIDMNLLSTIRMVYAALPHLRRSSQGRVIAITSMSAKQPLENLVLSNTTRAGVLGFMKSLANELGPTGITFNAILPGWTRTERVEVLLNSLAQTRQSTRDAEAARINATIPARRMGEVEEFAATVAFLASGRAGFINGVALQVDGGRVQSLY